MYYSTIHHSPNCIQYKLPPPIQCTTSEFYILPISPHSEGFLLCCIIYSHSPGYFQLIAVHITVHITFIQGSYYIYRGLVTVHITFIIRCFHPRIRVSVPCWFKARRFRAFKLMLGVRESTPGALFGSSVRGPWRGSVQPCPAVVPVAGRAASLAAAGAPR